MRERPGLSPVSTPCTAPQAFATFAACVTKSPRRWLTWRMHLTVPSPVQSLADIHRIEATPLAEAMPWASTYALIRASAQVHAEQPCADLFAHGPARRPVHHLDLPQLAARHPPNRQPAAPAGCEPLKMWWPFSCPADWPTTWRCGVARRRALCSRSTPCSATTNCCLCLRASQAKVLIAHGAGRRQPVARQSACACKPSCPV